MGASTINKVLLAFEADRTRGFEKAEPMWKPHVFISIYAIHARYIYLHSLSKPTTYRYCRYTWMVFAVGYVSTFCAMFSREALLGSQLGAVRGVFESRFTQFC